MVTLHLAHEDVALLTAGADGSYLLDLTPAGQRAVVTAAERITTTDVPGCRSSWLRTLTVNELVRLATARLGGPQSDVQAEAVRRAREALNRLQPAMTALHGLGVLSPAAEGGCHDGRMPR